MLTTAIRFHSTADAPCRSENEIAGAAAVENATRRDAVVGKDALRVALPSDAAPPDRVLPMPRNSRPKPAHRHVYAPGRGRNLPRCLPEVLPKCKIHVDDHAAGVAQGEAKNS